MASTSYETAQVPPRDVCFLKTPVVELSDKIRTRSRLSLRDHEKFPARLRCGFHRERSGEYLRTTEEILKREQNGIRAISFAKFRGPLNSNGEVNTREQ